MANGLIFFTNPRSKGRVVRWMLGDFGEPYGTEVIEYGDLAGNGRSARSKVAMPSRITPRV